MIPVGHIAVVTLIRTDTSLDHNQKAEKVRLHMIAAAICVHMHALTSNLFAASSPAPFLYLTHFSFDR